MATQTQEWRRIGPIFLENLNYGTEEPNREEQYFDITRREAQPAHDALKQLIDGSFSQSPSLVTLSKG